MKKTYFYLEKQNHQSNSDNSHMLKEKMLIKRPIRPIQVNPKSYLCHFFNSFGICFESIFILKYIKVINFLFFKNYFKNQYIKNIK